jgi:hypothetical protein
MKIAALSRIVDGEVMKLCAWLNALAVPGSPKLKLLRPISGTAL